MLLQMEMMPKLIISNWTLGTLLYFWQAYKYIRNLRITPYPLCVNYIQTIDSEILLRIIIKNIGGGYYVHWLVMGDWVFVQKSYSASRDPIS